MATTVALAYPSMLRAPQEAPYTPAERRALTALVGPRDVRAMERDIRGAKDLRFLFSNADLVIWRAWLASVLDSGGFFAAQWFQPDGQVAVFRFIGEPSYPQYRAPYGWQVTAHAELRGRGELPVAFISNCPEAIDSAELANTEVALTHEYVAHEPMPVPATAQTYVTKGRDPGTVGPGPGSEFITTFSIAWDDLESPDVNGFYNDRSGSGSSALYFALTVTDLPSESVAECKVIIFQTSGIWTTIGSEHGAVDNGWMIVNGQNKGFCTWTSGEPGVGYLAAALVLRVQNGVLSATVIT